MQGNRRNNQDISVNVEVTGSIAEALNRLGKKMTKDVLVEAVKAGATVVANSINERIPVETGELKGNLAIEIKTNKDAVSATVGFLDEFQASIAYWVEHGHNTRAAKTAMQKFFKMKKGSLTGMVPAHPFFRPGIDASLQEASKAVMAVIGQAMQVDQENVAAATAKAERTAAATAKREARAARLAARTPDQIKAAKDRALTRRERRARRNAILDGEAA